MDLETAIEKIKRRREKESVIAAQEFVEILHKKGKRPALAYFGELIKYKQDYIKRHHHYKWYLKNARIQF